MSDDLIGAVLDCSVDVEVTRHLSVAMDKGRKVDARVTTLEIDAAITPITGKDLKRLGEGFKTEGAILVITPDKLFTTDSSICNQPDKLRWHDDDYQISVVKDWTDQGGFYECVGTRIDR